MVMICIGRQPIPERPSLTSRPEPTRAKQTCVCKERRRRGPRCHHFSSLSACAV
jgi:hypothetical protein